MLDPLGNVAPETFMQVAIEEMRLCEGTGPKVGAVIVRKGEIVARSHRMNGVHAERIAIETAKAARVDLRGATLFTTLEPCSPMAKTDCCANLIKEAGIQTVYIGRFDTNPTVYREGWKILTHAGVLVRDFDEQNRLEIDKINNTFTNHFTIGVGPSGGAKFDYQLNEGKFEIRFSASDVRSILTKWSHRSATSIYACGVGSVRVALARHASRFEQIDDPTALLGSHSVPVGIDEIVVFTSPQGAILVQALEVIARHGEEGTVPRSLQIKYECRPR